ncbi:MAG: SpoIIE family protein phosphatase [Candidatus Rifleibacteriota bacterium]
MNVSEQVRLNKKFPLLFWVSMLFSFVIFPFFLIAAGLNRYYDLSENQTKNLLQAQLIRVMDFVGGNAEPDKFFHRKLEEIFDQAIKSREPASVFKQKIGQLKKQFPDLLTLIAWNHNGNLINEITDEKKFKYFLKRTFKLLFDLSRHLEKFCPAQADFLAAKSDEIRFLRSFLGQFLVASHLSNPYLEEGFGKAILADIPGNKSYFWYKVSPRLTILCFIARNENLSNKVLQQTIKETQKMFPTIQAGFYPVKDFSQMFPAPRPDLKPFLITAAGKFNNLHSEEFIETERIISSFRHLSPSWQCFAFSYKDHLKEIKNKKFINIFRSLGLLLIFAFVFFCYRLKSGNSSISIQYKIIGLFTYATVLPLLILSSIGFDYFNQMRSYLITQKQNHFHELLVEIDNQFETFISKFEFELRQSCKLFLRKRPIDFAELQKHVEKDFSLESVLIFDLLGNQLQKASTSNFVKDTFTLKQFAVSLLKLLNNRDPEVKLKGLFFDTTNFSRNMDIQNLEKIETFELFKKKLLYFCLPVSSKNFLHFDALIIFLWNMETLEKSFLLEKIDAFKNYFNNDELIFLNPGEHKYYGLQQKPDKSLRKLLHRAVSLNVADSAEIKQGNSDYIVSARAGKNMKNSVLAMMVPKKIIENEMNRVKLSLFTIIIFALLFALCLAIIVSDQLLNPLGKLKAGIQQIGLGNYANRISIDQKNELGKLAEALNLAGENMKELEIAQVVQENLFPESNFSTGCMQLSAKTVTMTRLGGDYYDYFDMKNSNFGIFLGDAAGHGIPAAMIMTVAKTIVSIMKESGIVSTSLLEQIQNAIYGLRKHEVKSMMTAQLVEINTAMGSGSILNCGHCYPVIISSNGNKAEQLMITGLPLGVLRKVNFKSIDFALEPNGYLILYSDGFLESKNNENEEMGSERFLDLLKKSWHPDPEKYLAAIFEANRQWAAWQSDDLTMILIKRKTS